MSTTKTTQKTRKPLTPKTPPIPPDNLNLDFDALLPQNPQISQISKLSPNPSSSISSSVDYAFLNITNNDTSSNNKTAFKDLLTAKELKFLETYLSGDLTIVQSMIESGYLGYHPRHLGRLGSAIIKKYEEQARDHREIFRTIGCGEVRVAKKVHKAMDSSRSEVAQFNYTQLAAKALGITGDISQASQGVTVIIQAQGDAPTQVNITPQDHSDSISYEHPRPAKPGQPILITK